jgi:hypothetical protein
MLLSLILACEPEPDAGDGDPVGALGLGRANPFPSVELVADGHVDLREGDLPQATDGLVWDYRTFNLREGFSVVQPAVANFEVAIDPETIGGSGSIGTDGTVRLVDLDSGESLPCFAELDAAEDALLTGLRTLIVRPMIAMTPGHRVAVVVTSAVTAGGGPLPVPEAQGHYAELRDELAALGQTDVQVAWDFPVAGGTALLDGVLAGVTTPTTHAWERTWEAGSGNEPAEGVWIQAEGSFTTENWLVDETRVEMDGGGEPTAAGTREALLWVSIPESVRDAAPGSVPVLVFGHGIMSEPSDYLKEDGDPNGVITVANELGAIVIATEWVGLREDDRLHAIEVARDFARFEEIPAMLAQGVASTQAMIRYASEGDLFDDPLFAGLADPGRIYYYGISLGGIEGAVTLANQDIIERGVLHVGGSAWATMLERSAQWPPFDVVVTDEFPDPWHRQQLYAATQVLWDPVDPASYVDKLAGRAFVWQESIGDEQVPNMTTELLARSANVPIATPNVTSPLALGMEPLTGAAPVVVQYDPETALPEEENRPAPSTGAHSDPRVWPGCIQQTVHFLGEGEVAHYCGDAACSASNPGSW